MANRTVLGVLAFCLVPSSSWAWSAMSYDVLEGTSRICSRHANEFNAGTCTLAHCRGSCEIVATYRETCAGLAFGGDGRWHVAFDGDPQRAAESALAMCRLAAPGECRLERLHCDQPR